MRLGGTVHTIVGVMPPGFRFPVNHRFWAPLRLNAAAYAPGDGPGVFVFGRLADGAMLDQAQAELATVGERLAAAFPESHARLRPRVMPYTYPYWIHFRLTPAVVVYTGGLAILAGVIVGGVPASPPIPPTGCSR